MLTAGHRVEEIGLGTAQFAFRDRTAAESVATVRAALNAGVTLIDTALAYTRPGVESYAEQVIATALRGVLLTWLRKQSPYIIPLVGTSRPASIRDSAALLELTDQDLADLAAAQSAPTCPAQRP